MNCFTFLFYCVWVKIYVPLGVYLWVKYIRSTRCLFMGQIIRSTIDFLYVKGNRFSAHKLPMIRPPSGTYYLTYNVTLRQLDSGCLGGFHQRLPKLPT